jgi:hypothetical protein
VRLQGGSGGKACRYGVRKFETRAAEMKLFACQNSSHLLYFENSSCEKCGLHTGYLPELEALSAVTPDGDKWIALARPQERYRFCANGRDVRATGWFRQIPRGRHSASPAGKTELSQMCRTRRAMPCGCNWRRPSAGLPASLQQRRRNRLPVPEALTFRRVGHLEIKASRNRRLVLFRSWGGACCGSAVV